MLVTWNSFLSPLGALTVVECDRGPLVVEFPSNKPKDTWAERVRRGRPGVRIDIGPCPQLESWLEAYFRGRPRTFPFPEYLPQYLTVDDASLEVWRLLSAIPFGETRSYDDLSQRTGHNPRRIGQMVGHNPLAICVPCHRVVGKHGELVGYGGGLRRKRWLLDHELRVSGVVLR